MSERVYNGVVTEELVVADADVGIDEEICDDGGRHDLGALVVG